MYERSKNNLCKIYSLMQDILRYCFFLLYCCVYETILSWHLILWLGHQVIIILKKIHLPIFDDILNIFSYFKLCIRDKLNKFVILILFPYLSWQAWGFTCSDLCVNRRKNQQNHQNSGKRKLSTSWFCTWLLIFMWTQNQPQNSWVMCMYASRKWLRKGKMLLVGMEVQLERETDESCLVEERIT